MCRIFCQLFMIFTIFLEIIGWKLRGILWDSIPFSSELVEMTKCVPRLIVFFRKSKNNCKRFTHILSLERCKLQGFFPRGIPKTQTAERMRIYPNLEDLEKNPDKWAYSRYRRPR